MKSWETLLHLKLNHCSPTMAAITFVPFTIFFSFHNFRLYCYVFATLRCTVNSKARMVSAPTGPFPNLYLDLSRHLHCLLCMQISPSDPLDHVMIRQCVLLRYSYHSYYGMLWYATVTQISPWHCLHTVYCSNTLYLV